MSTASGLVDLVMKEQSVSTRKRALKPVIGYFIGNYSGLFCTRLVKGRFFNMKVRICESIGWK